MATAFEARMCSTRNAPTGMIPLSECRRRKRKSWPSPVRSGETPPYIFDSPEPWDSPEARDSPECAGGFTVAAMKGLSSQESTKHYFAREVDSSRKVDSPQRHRDTEKNKWPLPPQLSS